VAIVTLGRTVHLFVASFAGLVAEVLVNFDWAWLAFMAFAAVAVNAILVSFVIEGHGALLVVIGVAVSSDSNGCTYECEKHHHDYKLFHFYLLFLLLKVPSVIASILEYSLYPNHVIKTADIEPYVGRCRFELL
jgi:hypothetical protein